MFASRLNYQIKPYVSRHPDPQPWAIDAFCIAWINSLLYTFPPFSVISQVVQKLEMAHVQKILVVTN